MLDKPDVQYVMHRVRSALAGETCNPTLDSPRIVTPDGSFSFMGQLCIEHESNYTVSPKKKTCRAHRIEPRSNYTVSPKKSLSCNFLSPTADALE